MSPTQHELVLPDLGMEPTPVILSLWLIEPGETVVEGDRIVEVLAGAATVDLPAPASGVLGRILVDEGERVAVGQTLAIIAGDEDEAADQERA